MAEIEAAGGEAIVAGDLNAFETESALTTLEGPGTSLDNLWDLPPESERYSYHFDGKLQTLDHMLVTDGLADRVDDFLYAHFDNDYYERRTEGDGHHLSDHDPPVLTLDLPGAPVNVTAPAVVRTHPGAAPRQAGHPRRDADRGPGRVGRGRGRAVVRLPVAPRRRADRGRHR